MENKENARPAYIIREDTDSDSGDGPVLYRDDDDEESTYGTDSWITNNRHTWVHEIVCAALHEVAWLWQSN